MPIEINAEVEGLDRLFRKLDHLAAVEVLKPPMEASLLVLVDFMEDYPGPPMRPYPKMLRTPKQRRYFFWALAQGIIKVPYVRSGKLGQSWTWEVTTSGDGVHGKAGTNLKYAPRVQSKQLQALIHQGNWQTDAEAIEAKQDEIVQRFRNAISEALARG